MDVFFPTRREDEVLDVMLIRADQQDPMIEA